MACTGNISIQAIGIRINHGLITVICISIITGLKVLVLQNRHTINTSCIRAVPDPGKGVCVDPVDRGAILEGGGPGPPSGEKERQLSPDEGRGKT
jgi:hypothetical protein